MSFPRNTIAAVFDRLDASGDCWLYVGPLMTNGYAGMHLEGEHVLVHRAVYEHLVGPIPDGMQLDHLCRVRHCANPDHLEPVTALENQRRGRGGRLTRRTHCPHGHAWDAANTRQRPHRQGRTCRACMRAAQRRYLARRAAA